MTRKELVEHLLAEHKDDVPDPVVHILSPLGLVASHRISHGHGRANHEHPRPAEEQVSVRHNFVPRGMSDIAPNLAEDTPERERDEFPALPDPTEVG